MDQSRKRNFCIIAHIDHGKSTLADRLMELTQTIEKRQLREQTLDRMDLERERGITIKLAPVHMKYKDYELNLIDTPGHVDFSYEVSRSLAAVEGAVLVIDATQGIQAQTLSNIHLAEEAGLKVIPVLNKIDLPAADTETLSLEIMELLGCQQQDIQLTSAKTGQGAEALLDKILSTVPPPSGDSKGPTRALIFDSYFDPHRGVVLYVRIVDGEISKSDQLRMLGADRTATALEVGFLNPDMSPTHGLQAGDIGFIVTNLKTARNAKVGDTVTLANLPSTKPLPGYKDVEPFVYAGFFPASHQQYQALKDGVEKLSLSDSSLQFSLEKSPVLGFGLRLGFLGLLHMDIVRERLSREYDLDLIVTNPSCDYQVRLQNGQSTHIKSAAELPDDSSFTEILEPWVSGEIVCPSIYLGKVLQLVNGSRGLQKGLRYITSLNPKDGGLVVVDFEAPLSSLITDFYDKLKNITSGYGSFNYQLTNYRTGDLVKLDIYVAGDKIDSLSTIVHRSQAVPIGQSTVKKLKEIIPKQQFKVSLQAALGGQFIAREDVSAYRKDVTAGLYGGDVTRKKKVLTKQKKGKERMRRFGKVDIPAEAFAVMLKQD
ncbi:MAG: translation elongation factor 4 [Candidatus Saccharimonadales bacterium]